MWEWFKRKFLAPVRPDHHEMVEMFYGQLERMEPSIHVYPWETEAFQCAKALYQIDMEIADIKRRERMRGGINIPGIP